MNRYHEYDEMIVESVPMDFTELNLDIHVEVEDGKSFITGVDVDAEELKKKFLAQVDLFDLTQKYNKKQYESYVQTIGR